MFFICILGSLWNEVCEVAMKIKWNKECKVLSSPCLYIARLWKQTGFIITIFIYTKSRGKGKSLERGLWMWGPVGVGQRGQGLHCPLCSPFLLCGLIPDTSPSQQPFVQCMNTTEAHSRWCMKCEIRYIGKKMKCVSKYVKVKALTKYV